MVTQDLAFDNAIWNSTTGYSDRAYVSGTLQWVVMFMQHISRRAEDPMIYTDGWIRLCPSFRWLLHRKLSGAAEEEPGQPVDGTKSKAAPGPFVLTRDVANYLVRKGICFRETHHISGRRVVKLEETGMSELSFEHLKPLTAASRRIMTRSLWARRASRRPGETPQPTDSC